MTKPQREFARRLVHDSSTLCDFIEWLPYIDIPARKAILIICRTGADISKRCRVVERCHPELSRVFSRRTRKGEEALTLSEILIPLLPFTTSHYYSGLVSMLTRFIPCEPSEIEAIIESSVAKEVLAISTPRPKTILLWENYLLPPSSNAAEYPLSPIHPYDYSTHINIYAGFLQARISITGKRYYPAYSRKTLPTAADEHLRRLWIFDDIDYSPSTLGLEILYSRTGIKLSEETEIRCAFKYHDLRPRTYFARGPADYYPSRYIQPIFNTLIDSFQSTHRVYRYDTSLVRLEDDEVLFIYDYSAFTSSLHEVNTFLYNLSYFFEGTFVTVVDTLKGELSVSLGQVIRDYVDQCNRQSPFLSLKEPHGDPMEYESRLLFSETGKLGVPGNITSCTLLHGLHLMIVCMSILIKVIGDDALGKLKKEDYPFLNKLLRCIGDISEEKQEYWQQPDFPESYDPVEDTWHYTKRPITRVNERVAREPFSVIWPSVGVLFPELADEAHTVVVKSKSIKTIASSLITFVNQFENAVLDLVEKLWINKFIKEILLRSGMVEENERRLGIWPKRGIRLIFPLCVEEGIDRELWRQRMVGSRVPVRIPEEFVYTDIDDEFQREVEYVGMVTPALRLARDLGYADYEKRFTEFLPRDYPERLDLIFSREKYRASVDLVIRSCCPSWLFGLVKASLTPTPYSIYQDVACYDSDDDDDE